MFREGMTFAAQNERRVVKSKKNDMAGDVVPLFAIVVGVESMVMKCRSQEEIAALCRRC